MNKSILGIFIFCSIISFPGCSSSKTSSQGKISPFAGTWNFVYEGIYAGSTELKIDQDGQYGVTIEVSKDTHSFTNYIYGEVSETGEVTGSISLSEKRIGSLSGMMKEKIGNGVYKTQRGQGTWNAAIK
jgi:hypothetical protein